MSGPVLALFEAARTDTALMQAALQVEEVCAQAYEVAANGPLQAAERSFARRFAGHEREHAAAFETMLFALAAPVRDHAAPGDLDALAPGLRGAGRRDALRALAELEGAAIAGHQLMARRLEALDALRTVAVVMAAASQHLVVLRHALGERELTHAFETGS